MNGQNYGWLTKNSLISMMFIQILLLFFDFYAYLPWVNFDANNYTTVIGLVLMLHVVSVHCLMSTIMFIVYWDIEAIYDIEETFSPCVYSLSTNSLYLKLMIIYGIVSTIVNIILLLNEFEDTQLPSVRFTIALFTVELINTIAIYILLILTLLRIKKSIYTDRIIDSALDEV